VNRRAKFGSARTDTPYVNFPGRVGVPVHDPATSSPMHYLEVDGSFEEPSQFVYQTNLKE
jgi:hypothetical protein